MAEVEDELAVREVAGAARAPFSNAEIGAAVDVSPSVRASTTDARGVSDNPVERRVAELFVNREREQKRFQRMLEMRESPIFIVSGASGLGKTWLASRLAKESVRQGCHTVTLACSEFRTPTCETIMRTIASTIGVDKFGKLAIALSFVGEEERFTAESARLERGSTSSVESRKRDRRMVLTSAFFEDLAHIGQEKRVVIFFDAVEKMTTSSRAWLTDALLPALVDGRLTNVFIGIFGQAPMRLDASIEPIAIALQLSPFGVEDVVDYLQKVGVDPKVSHPLAALLMTVSRGIPHDLAMHVASHRDALLAVAT